MLDADDIRPYIVFSVGVDFNTDSHKVCAVLKHPWLKEAHQVNIVVSEEFLFNVRQSLGLDTKFFIIEHMLIPRFLDALNKIPECFDSVSPPISKLP